MHARRGYSLLEVIVSLAVLLVGVLAVIYFFPKALESRNQAAVLTNASLLAQMKAEEVRRDDDTSGTMVTSIQGLTAPTLPKRFGQDSTLSYSFSGRSLIYPETDSPRGDPGVARVIIVRTQRVTPEARPEDVIYEMRFGS